MKRLILALLMAILILAPTISVSDPLPYASIAPLAQIYYDEEGTASFNNVCTATNINEKEHYWLTANHCVEDAAPKVKHYIKGEPVGYVMRDPTNDLAILSTPVSTAPALRLAATAPSVGDHITVIGHPLGQIYPITVVGQVAATKIVFATLDTNFTLLQVPGGPGSSGSSVLNDRNEIVSVIQRGTSPNNWGPVMAGCTFEKLQALALWWAK